MNLRVENGYFHLVSTQSLETALRKKQRDFSLSRKASVEELLLALEIVH